MKAWRPPVSCWACSASIACSPKSPCLAWWHWRSGCLPRYSFTTGLLSPAVVGLGSLLRRFVPDRGRRYLQAALLMGTLVTVVALPMIYLRGSQPPVKALLLRNYGLNLTLILGLIATITLSLHAIQVARDSKSAEPDNRSDEHLRAE